MAPDALPEPVRVALEFTGFLEQLGVAYVVSGSLASSLHGEPRSTNDIDIVADLLPEHVASLAAKLQPAYYVSADSMAEAVRTGASFNAIHLESAVKVDVFIVGADSFDRERVNQGLTVRLGEHPQAILRVDRPEFTVLRKLEWFRRGGERSERRRDILGVLRVQGTRLDQSLLASWAHQLGVSDLLQRARQESGGEPS